MNLEPTPPVRSAHAIHSTHWHDLGHPTHLPHAGHSSEVGDMRGMTLIPNPLRESHTFIHSFIIQLN